VANDKIRDGSSNLPILTFPDFVSLTCGSHHMQGPLVSDTKSGKVRVRKLEDPAPIKSPPCPSPAPLSSSGRCSPSTTPSVAPGLPRAGRRLRRAALVEASAPYHATPPSAPPPDLQHLPPLESVATTAMAPRAHLHQLPRVVAGAVGLGLMAVGLDVEKTGALAGYRLGQAGCPYGSAPAAPRQPTTVGRPRMPPGLDTPCVPLR
jgi:hypothetical protein